MFSGFSPAMCRAKTSVDHRAHRLGADGGGIDLAPADDAVVGGELDEGEVAAAEARRRVADDEDLEVAELHARVPEDDDVAPVGAGAGGGESLVDGSSG